jgi:hypothetical protein
MHAFVTPIRTLHRYVHATPRRAAGLAVLAVLAAASLFAPRPALAQAACTEIENDAARLACYDRALRPARPAPAASASQAAPAVTPEPRRNEAATAETVEPRNGRAARRAANAETPPAPAAPTAPSPPPPVAQQPVPQGITPIVVVNVRPLLGRNDKVFTTDSGMVWVQTDNARVMYPDTPFNAQIKPGMMGSFFLSTDERTRAVRVRRGE